MSRDIVVRLRDPSGACQADTEEAADTIETLRAGVVAMMRIHAHLDTTLSGLAFNYRRRRASDLGREFHECLCGHDMDDHAEPGHCRREYCGCTMYVEREPTE